MIKGDGTRREFPVVRDRLVVGRTNTVDLRIPVSSVSRRHCELVIQDGQLWIHDLGSSNGTFHNDTRVQKAALKAGDRVGIGPVIFNVVIDGEPAHLVGDHAVSPKGKDVPAPHKSAVGKALPVADNEDLPVTIEDEQHSPTVDLDDPVSALEALAQAADDDDDIPVLELDDDDDDVKK